MLTEVLEFASTSWDPGTSEDKRGGEGLPGHVATPSVDGLKGPSGSRFDPESAKQIPGTRAREADRFW